MDHAGIGERRFIKGEFPESCQPSELDQTGIGDAVPSRES